MEGSSSQRRRIHWSHRNGIPDKAEACVSKVGYKVSNIAFRCNPLKLLIATSDILYTLPPSLWTMKRMWSTCPESIHFSWPAGKLVIVAVVWFLFKTENTLHFVSHLLLWVLWVYEETRLLSQISRNFSVALTLNFAFLPRKLMVSHTQGFCSLLSVFL